MPSILPPRAIGRRPRKSLRKGCFQLYTGNGKGKTTAALGLALRAAGAGLRVYIAQFAKGTKTGELTLLRKLSPTIAIRQFGATSFLRRPPSAADRALAARGLATVSRIIRQGRYDVVILDELCIACDYDLVPLQSVIDMIEARPGHVEIVVTGRKAPKALIELADLVTEMKEIKHYFAAGVRARKGIEY